jgi:DnaJ-domain-containing protein 1
VGAHTGGVSTLTTDSDLYALLGVTTSATSAEIGAAFRARAKELHPDRHRGDADTTEAFKELTNAYDVLSRPARRAAYDQHRAAPRRAAAPPPAPSGHAPIFRTPARARVAITSGAVLFVLGVAAAVVLALVPIGGDATKAITLWIVVVKLVVCGVVLAAVGRWRLHRLRTGHA